MKKCYSCGNITFANQLIDGIENDEEGKYFLTSYCLACGIVQPTRRRLSKATYDKWIDKQLVSSNY